MRTDAEKKKSVKLVKKEGKPAEHLPVYVAENDESEKNTTWEGEPVLAEDQQAIYQKALRILNETGVKYAVGASFARHAYTSIWRPTKDLDVFIKPDDLWTVMNAFKAASFKTEIREEHWLAKAWKKDYFIDLIFGQGHGLFSINDKVFEGSKQGEVLGEWTYLIPIEEMIASAAYIATCGRFDGGEIVHLIRAAKGKLDWQRILERLGENRELLLWHLILFDYVYPGHSDYLPKALMLNIFEEIKERWSSEKQDPRSFRGSMLDPFLFSVDVEDWGYEDQRQMKPIVDGDGRLL